MVFSGEAVPHALRAILMVPPVCMIAADGAVSIYEWLSHRAPESRARGRGRRFVRGK